MTILVPSLQVGGDWWIRKISGPAPSRSLVFVPCFESVLRRSTNEYGRFQLWHHYVCFSVLQIGICNELVFADYLVNVICFPLLSLLIRFETLQRACFCGLWIGLFPHIVYTCFMPAPKPYGNSFTSMPNHDWDLLHVVILPVISAT